MRKVSFVLLLLLVTNNSIFSQAVVHDPKANISLASIVASARQLYKETKQQAKDISKASYILADLNVIQAHQNESIQDIHSYYKSIGRGTIFKDAIDEVYTYERRRTHRNISELSAIGDRLGLPKDYLAETEQSIREVALDYYHGGQSIDEDTQANIAKSQKDRAEVKNLNSKGRDQLQLKQNAQQYETQQMILDYTRKSSESMNKIHKLIELDRLEKNREDAKKKIVFKETEELGEAEKEKSKNLLMMFLR